MGLAAVMWEAVMHVGGFGWSWVAGRAGVLGCLQCIALACVATQRQVMPRVSRVPYVPPHVCVCLCVVLLAGV